MLSISFVLKVDFFLKVTPEVGDSGRNNVIVTMGH